jgi:hypothetical protein
LTGTVFPSTSEGTRESHPSSSEETVDALDVYHEPAWLAFLAVIVMSWTRKRISPAEIANEIERQLDFAAPDF